MILARAEKIERLNRVIPLQEVYGPKRGDLLIVGWGGYLRCGPARPFNVRWHKIDRLPHAHLRYLNPFPANLGEILHSYKQVLIPELNMGQLALLIRGKYGVDVTPYPKLHARPIKISEIDAQIDAMLEKRA